MFHKIKCIAALPDFKLSVQFAVGVTKIYDMAPLVEKLPVFEELKYDVQLFNCVEVDVGGYGIIWNDDLDLSYDELWENGVTVALLCRSNGILRFNWDLMMVSSTKT